MTGEAFLQALEAEDGCLEGIRLTGAHVEGRRLYGAEFKSVEFMDCVFSGCNLANTGFYHCTLTACDVSGCNLADSYWKNCTLTGCKGDRANFSGAHFRETRIADGSFCFAGFAKTVLDGCLQETSLFRETAFPEVRLKKTRFRRLDLTRADFFHTPLKGMDLSDCDIPGLMVSDTFQELKDIKLSYGQAVDVAQLLGIKLI